VRLPERSASRPERSASRGGLVLGYGNPGRGDDGLAVRLVELLSPGAPAGVDLEAAFQPGIEHAAAVAEHDWVLFVDAAAEGPSPCSVRRVEPLPNAAFSTHVVDLGSILAIAAQSFGSRTPAWLLAVRGYDFGIAEELSERAARNLDAALARAREFVERQQREGVRNGDNRERDDPDHR
jgi:hydrogenase maturation protease